MPGDDEDGWEFDTSDVESAAEDSDSEDSEWRFSIDEVGDDADAEADERDPAFDRVGETEDHQSAVGGNVFGSYDSDTEVIEPGSPSAENVFFVVVGVLLALFVFVQFYLIVA